MNGVWSRMKLACGAFVTILFKGHLPAVLQQRPTAAPVLPVSVGADMGDRAVQVLALLQRDGRFVCPVWRFLGKVRKRTPRGRHEQDSLLASRP